MHLSWQNFMVKQLWEYCVWKNRLSWINLLLSIVQWSHTPFIRCVDVHLGVLHKVLHHLQFTIPEVTWTKRHSWMINKFDHAVVDDHTVCIVSGTMTLCTIIILVNNHSKFNYIINAGYTLFGYIQRMMISSFCRVWPARPYTPPSLLLCWVVLLRGINYYYNNSCFFYFLNTS